MRGKAQMSFLGVAQPRFRGATFRTIVPAPWFPLFANPALSCRRKVVSLPLLVLLIYVSVKCASTPHLGIPVDLDSVGVGSTTPFFSGPSTTTSGTVVLVVHELLGYVSTTIIAKRGMFTRFAQSCVLTFRSNMRVSWRLRLCWSIKPQVE
jgi:hypothetical protein